MGHIVDNDNSPNDEPASTSSVTTVTNKWAENAKAAQAANKEKFAKLKNFFRGYWARKKWTLPLTVLVLLVAILGVPYTRYKTLGLFIHEQVMVRVLDNQTDQPVIGATVKVGNATSPTDKNGIASVKAPLGNATLQVSKQYYANATQQITVSWPQAHDAFSIKLVATGRQVPIIIRDKITSKGIAGAELKVGSSDVKTNKDGMATIVLPAGKPTLDGTVSANGFLSKKVTVTVTSEYTHNIFEIVPSGKLYFLSNLSGKIDVVKTNLDGSERETILAGTGKEDAYTTALLASRDWKYLALLSKRDGNQGVYLINTATDQVTNIDGGNSANTFTLVGWSNDTFIYQVSHSNVKNWQSGATALKSYAADSGRLYSLDQTQGEGTSLDDYGYTTFGTVSILDNELVYAKNWYGNNSHLTGKNDSLVSVRPDGSNKRSIKDFPVPASTQFGYTLGTLQFEPYGIYVQVPNGDNTNSYYQYDGGKLSQNTSINDDVYNKSYPTFLISPSDNQTFWSDVRDNKNTLFVGNAAGANAKQIAMLSDYTPYGWYTDNYLLVSKGGSVLYIMPADGSSVTPAKVTDYYKPQLNFRGYGGGYGGL